MNDVAYYENANRIKALKRFAFTTTIVSLLGHLVLGFEQAYAYPFVGVLSACGTQLVLDAAAALQSGKRPAFAKGWRRAFHSLLPAYIVGLTCAMFLYAGSRIAPIAFASVLAIGSKFLFQVPMAGARRHFLNPSNFGILATLVAFPAVCITLPYGFSSQVGDASKAALPIVLFVAGAFLNATVTKKIPLVAAWLGSFVVQAVIRHFLFDSNLVAALAPATGPIAILFTFFMVTDPGTTPERPVPQVMFGSAVGLLYGVFFETHVVYALFWALFTVCCCRGVASLVYARRGNSKGHLPSETSHEGDGPAPTMRQANAS